jgi:hypothetical protein
VQDWVPVAGDFWRKSGLDQPILTVGSFFKMVEFLSLRSSSIQNVGKLQ